jgi:hypothetical protein
MTKDEAKEEMEKAKCEETEKTILKMYIENIRGRRAEEHTTEKFDDLLSESILLPLDYDYRDIVRHMTQYEAVRKQRNKDSIIVIEPR